MSGRGRRAGVYAKSWLRPDSRLSGPKSYVNWIVQGVLALEKVTGRPDEARHYAGEEAKHRAVFAERYVGRDRCLKDEYKGQCNDLYMLKLGLCGNAAAVETTKKDLIANIRAHGNRLQTGFTSCG